MILSSLAAILLIVVVFTPKFKGGGDSSFGNVNQLGGLLNPPKL